MLDFYIVTDCTERGLYRKAKQVKRISQNCPEAKDDMQKGCNHYGKTGKEEKRKQAGFFPAAQTEKGMQSRFR